MKCWGYNGGALGDGTTTNRSTPVDVIGLSSGVTSISAGFGATCAAAGGALKCWGSNSYGQLGDGTNTGSTSPVNVVGVGSGVRAVSTSGSHSCAITNGGGLKCWGQNTFGELGDRTLENKNTAVEVVGLRRGVTAVSLGDKHSCALTSQGEVKCWGSNYVGQVGDGTTLDRLLPANLPGLTSGVNALSAGDYHTCALISGGGVKCWGSNGALGIGDGTYPYKSVPVEVLATQDLPPIILLPGIMGSRLRYDPNPQCAGPRYSQTGEVWLNYINFALMYDSLYLKEAAPLPLYDCDIITPNGIFDSGDFDAYSNLIETLSKDYQVIPFAYDWRLSMAYNAGKLDQLINNLESSQVVLLGHSMGGLLARYYTLDAARAVKVSKVISVGTPYWGAPKMALNMRAGMLPKDLKIPETNLSLALSLQFVYTLIRNSPGSMELLPSDAYFGALGSGYYWDDDQRLGNFDQTRDYFVNDPGKWGGQNLLLLNQARAFHQAIDDFSNNLNTEYHILATQHLVTDTGIREYPCFWNLNLCWEITDVRMGDETVPYASGSLPGKAGAAQVVSFSSGEVSNAHSQLMRDDAIISAVQNILAGLPPKSASQTNLVLAPLAFLQIFITGDTTVTVEDGAGRFIETYPDGYVYNEIPRSTYEILPAMVVVSLPADSPYTLTIQQKGDLPVEIKVSEITALSEADALEPSARAVYAQVALARGGLASLPLDHTAGLGSLALAIDQDANGAPETSLPPDSLLDYQAIQDITSPQTSIVIQESPNANGFYSGPVTITLSAVDDHSAILFTEYSLDQGRTWLRYSTPFTMVAESARYLLAKSVDVAGNHEYPFAQQALSSPRFYLPIIQR